MSTGKNVVERRAELEVELRRMAEQRAELQRQLTLLTEQMLRFEGAVLAYREVEQAEEAELLAEAEEPEED